MLISTIPAQHLKSIIGHWKQGDNLQSFVGGQLFGTINVIELDNPHDIFLTTSTNIVLEDCALMTWIEQQTRESVTVGCQWASDHESGAITLSKGEFKEFRVSTETLMELQKVLLLANTEASEIDALRDEKKTEEEIQDILYEWSDEYRVLARDGLQREFLCSVHEENDQLTDYPYFMMLAELGHQWTVNALPDMAVSAQQLLVSIDYRSPQCIDLIFGQKSEEFWKDHRDRVRAILRNVPTQTKDNKDFFKNVIPKVAAWTLEYASPSVR